MGRSISTSTSTNVGLKLNPYFRQILKHFFKTILVTSEHLLTQPEVESNKTLSFSRKKYKTGPLTLNNFSLLSRNLMKKEL